jgi:hypothetical protein
MRRGHFFFLGLGIVFVGACGGADESALLDGGASGDDGGSGGDVIVGKDVGPVEGGPNCEPKCATIPLGFRPVRLGSANTACPSGWVTADGFTNPTATDGACTCNCSVTQNPDCTQGKIVRAFDDSTSPTCTSPATQLSGNGGLCTQIGGTLVFNHTHYVADPPPPSGGACQYDAQLDKGKLGGTPVRLCAPPQSCEGQICDGGSICVATDGDQACPGDFPTKTVMGDAVTGTCGSCGSCTASGTCTGTISFYADQLCQTTSTDVVADAVCKANTISTSLGFVSYTWKGSLVKATCAGTPSSTATPSLDQPITVCCK